MGKRIFDIFFSVTGILVVLPLLLILFFLVVIESRGGFLYFQKRVGRNGIDLSSIK